MKIYSSHQKLFIPLISILLLIAGCGTWGNFTTYFNRYYNIKTLFDKAEKSILAQKKDLFDTEEMKITGLARKQLTNVIKDASKILQFNSDSKYVDDALLILGKSFFYEKNYQKALRKFEELIATQPKSDLILETKLWIGKTQMRQKQEDKGLNTLAVVKQEAIKEDATSIVQEAFIEEITYLIKQKDYTAAIKSANDFLANSDDEDMNAKVWYELGKLNFDNKDYANAQKAYLQTIDLASGYKVIYNAKIELAKSLRNGGNLEKALKLLDGMRSEDKNADNFSEIDLEKGMTLLDENKVQQAKALLIKVDTTYPGSSFSAIAKFRLAEIYEKDLLNFDSAKVYYQQAGYSRLPKEYKLEDNKKVALFKNYSKLADGIKLFSRQIDYINNPEEFTKDSVAYYKQKEIERERLLSKQKNLTKITKTNINQTKNIKSNNLTNNPLLKIKNENITKTKTTTINNVIGNKFPKKVKLPPVRPTLKADSLQSLILNYQFDLANLYVTEFNLPDSVYKYFTYILSNYPGSKYEAQSQFSLGNYYLNKGDTLKADSLFTQIYENHKNERIVNSAAVMINKPLIDFDYDPAMEFYNTAESNLEKGNYKEAIPGFFNIYKNHPKSKYAPKALYAAGWALENDLSMPDSAAAMYSLIKQKYPTTVYGRKISAKISIYNQEVKRKELLKEAKKRAELNKKKEELKKGKNNITTVVKDSLNTIKQPIKKRNLNLPNMSIFDSLKKLGINLPDSVRRKILLERRNKLIRNRKFKKDSILIER